ncbi:hypothetical protein N2152v2_010421 [Parachlorella kessleri]
MQKISEAFKQQRSGQARPDAVSRKAAHEQAVPSSYGVAVTPAVVDPPTSPSSSAQEDEAVLRQFDLDSKFGPCSGMSRLERWERAVRLGLDPPVQVRELVLRHGESTITNRCLWEHPY